MAARKIPSSFQLLGHTIEVLQEEKLTASDGTECDGLWTHDKLTIQLKADLKPSLKVHTFFHEVTHAIFDLCGYEKLSDDEDLVDSLGGALAQIDQTRRL